MKRSLFASMTACAAMVFGLAVQAAPMLSLSSSANLSTLTVGQTTTISVSLSGLTVGQQLQELLGSISFSPTLFAQPTSVTAGPIVPTITAPIFQTNTATPGFVDGLFDTGGLVGTTPITTNGVFFSFTLRAIATGVGSVGFDTVDGLFFNPADRFSPIAANVVAGPDLPVTIRAAGGGAVPLPAGLNAGLFTIGILLAGKKLSDTASRKNLAA